MYIILDIDFKYVFFCKYVFFFSVSASVMLLYLNLCLLIFLIYSLKEKLSVLEDENHIMRQKALAVSPKSNRRGYEKASVPEVIYAD